MGAASETDPDRGPVLRLGRLPLRSPVVLAPMAGVTDSVFRGLCRRYGGGLFVSEMVIAHTLVQGSLKSKLATSFAEHDAPRSIQLFAVEPDSLERAVSLLVGESGVDHIDLNFGCPMPKITRRGGGAAIPLRPRLFAAIIRAAVRRSEGVPITAKFRMGLDDHHLSYLESGRIARDEGAAAVMLHARTAAMGYGGRARWEAIGALKDAVGSCFPVLGNGDIASGADARAMMDQSGCDGVVIGRGCLGRPWLFEELDHTVLGAPTVIAPKWAEAKAVVLEHLARAIEHRKGWDRGGNEQDAELAALRAFRKHLLWYLQPYLNAGRDHDEIRRAAVEVASADDVRRCAEALDPATAPQSATASAWQREDRTQSRVVLPQGWLQAARADSEESAPSEPHQRRWSAQLPTDWNKGDNIAIDGG